MTSARRAALSLMLLTIVATVVPAGASAAGEIDGTAPRMLVVSLPGITWSDVAEHDLPALLGFLQDAALADLAPRGVSPRSGPGDAYLTISAGARSSTVRAIDGQVLALEEQSSGSAAGEIFTRRTGITPGGQFVALGWPALVGSNAAQPYDAVPGLLVETLDEAGITSSAVGNADGTDSIGASYERQVGLALADTNGVVANGALGRELLVEDPTRPFGVRTDIDAVWAAVEASWDAAPGSNGHVVVVEGSDLARTIRYRPMVDSGRYATLWQQALQEADQLLAGLLALVDPSQDTVLLVAPYNLPGDRDLTIVGLRGPGQAAGFLRSASTQRSGFLTLVDVAPTILRQLNVARPVEMEGRPAEVVPSAASLDRRIDRLISLNDASRFRERLLVPTTMVAVMSMSLLAALAAVLLARGDGHRFRPWVRLGVLGVLAVLPLSFLARGFSPEVRGTGFYWTFVLLGAGLVAATATAAARGAGRPRWALVAVLALVLAVPVLDVMTGSRLSISAAFGYSPTGNSRLYGISNYAYGMLSAAACVLAALLAGTAPPRSSKAAAIALLVGALVVLGVPIWGSDVGGVLAFTPAIGTFGVVLWARRIRLRTLVAAAVATAVALTAFGLLDLARPPEQRAHLGRLFERVADEGLGPLFSIMERKLLANLSVSTSSLWVAAIPVAAAFWVFLTRFPGPPIAPLRASIPTLRAGLAAAVVAAVLGSLVNDSGAIVGGAAALVLTGALVHLVLEARPEPE